MKISKKFCSIILTLLAITSSPCFSYKILLTMVFGSKSHLNFYGGIVDSLLKNGHQVRFCTRVHLTRKNNAPSATWIFRAVSMAFFSGLFCVVSTDGRASSSSSSLLTFSHPFFIHTYSLSLSSSIF